MSNRVNSVRKKQLLKDNMNKRGISGPLADLDLNLNIKYSTSGELYQKLNSSIKRRVNAMLPNISTQEFLDFINSINGNRKIKDIRILDYDDMQVRLLYACLGDLPDRNLYEKDVPLELVYQDFDGEEYKGYTFLRKPMKKQFHWTKRKLKGTRYDFDWIFDLSNLILEFFLPNALEKFAIANERIIQYKFVNYLLNTHRYNAGYEIKKVPTKEPFKTAFLEICEEFSLLEGVAYEEGTKMDAYEKYFFFQEGEKVGDVPKRLEQVQNSFLRPIVLKEFVEAYDYAKEKTKRSIDDEAAYARAFETKKHINLSHQRRMKNNAFLNRYASVELDNDVDLDEFTKLEREFRELCNKVFVPYSDGSFRIKKLGRHRAAGIYFSHANATIFDLDSPDAFIHEMAHQMDFTLVKGSMLSESLAFRPIIDKYKEVVLNKIEQLPNDNPFLVQWRGSTKYNKSYYFQSTEIFARSYELYIHHKKIETSFIKSSYNGYEYSNDEQYIKLVTKYFDNLLSMFGASQPKEEKAASKPSSAPKVDYEIELIEGEKGQLAFF